MLWFLICSYSRQNFLSSCKSNEIDPAHLTHNNLPLTIGNKFRNQINQQNTPPDVLNVNQQRYYHDVLDNFSTNTNYNNLKISTSSSTNSHPTTGVASILSAAVGQATAINSVAPNSANDPNLLNSIANNSNNNNENRYVGLSFFGISKTTNIWTFFIGKLTGVVTIKNQ